MCAKGGNSVCLAGTCSEGTAQISKCSRNLRITLSYIDEFGLGNRMWEECNYRFFQGRGMCAKGGNSVCLAGTCSEVPAQIQNVQEKNNLSYTMNLGWVTGSGRSLTKVITRVEGCVLKEEIVFVWLELVQKASPNSKSYARKE